MKKILLLSFLLLSLHCKAQNYNCFVPGAYQYFISSDGYLRGMHLDSVKQDTNKTSYYPFHTLRGNWSRDIQHQLPPLDSNGGSWLGKDVERFNNGTFLYYNYWGDTVVIKTQANVTDSWILYNDSTYKQFVATVISIDTMTVLGVLDSVKEIKIAEYDSGILNTADTTWRIALTKAHGFANVFELYMFPFHPVNSIYPSVVDYYTDPVMFKQILFHNPTYAEINDHNVGDVLEGHVNQYRNIEYLDTVVSKLVFSNSMEYVIHKWTKYTDGGGSPTAPMFSIDSLVVGNEPYFDTSFMPETYRNGYMTPSVYYWPGDTTRCLVGDVFRIRSVDIIRYSNGYQGPPELGYCPTDFSFKLGIGDQLYYGIIDILSCEYDVAHSSGLDYSYKQGSASCGGFWDFLSVSNIPKPIQLDIYPNPASEQLNVKVSGSRSYDLSIVNVIGQQVYKQTNCRNTETIDVQHFPSGIFIVIVTDENGHADYKKIVVQH